MLIPPQVALFFILSVLSTHHLICSAMKTSKTKDKMEQEFWDANTNELQTVKTRLAKYSGKDDQKLRNICEAVLGQAVCKASKYYDGVSIIEAQVQFRSKNLENQNYIGIHLLACPCGPGEVYYIHETANPNVDNQIHKFYYVLQDGYDKIGRKVVYFEYESRVDQSIEGSGTSENDDDNEGAGAAKEKRRKVDKPSIGSKTSGHASSEATEGSGSKENRRRRRKSVASEWKYLER